MTLLGHTDIVNTCDVSADGKWIASGSSDKQVRIWEAASGREVRTLPHEASVEICVFSPDGSRILTGTREGAVRLWDAVHYELLFHEQLHGDAVANGAFSKDGCRFATTAWDSNLVVCETTGRLLRTLPQESPVLSCDFGIDGERILCGTNEGRLRLWHIDSGQEGEGPDGHNGAIYRCMFSQDGSWILSCSQDGTLKRWDARTNALTATYTGHKGPVWTFDVVEGDADTRLVSGSDDKTLILWDFTTAVPLETLRDHAGAIWGVAWAPDGNTFVSAAWDWTVKVWGASARAAAKTPVRHAGHDLAVAPSAGPVICCDASRDGRLLAAGSSDGHVRVWDARTAALVANIAAHRDYALVVAFSPDGRIVSGAFNGEVALHDVRASGRPMRLDGHERQRILACRFSSSGDRLLTCSVNRVQVWDMDAAAAHPIASIDRQDPSISTCGLAADGSWAVVGDENGQLTVVQLPDGTVRSTIGTHSGLRHSALSPDGRTLASVSSDGTLRLWDVEGAREIVGTQAHDDVIEACNFSPDGTRVVTASWDATVRVWPVPMLSQPTTLQGHTDQMQDACFTPDGTRILSACMDTTVRLWDARTGAEVGSLMRPADAATICAFTADGRQILSASHRHHVRVGAAAARGGERVLVAHTGDVRACAFSPDGSRLVTASADHTLKLWDTRRWKEMRTYIGHAGPVQSCSFSPDGRRIASGSCDGTVRLWATDDGQAVVIARSEDWVRSVLWVGDTLASCHGGSVDVHDRSGARHVTTLRGHHDVIHAMALSKDGSRLISASADGEIRLWDVPSGRELFADAAHRGAVECCGFFESGAVAFSASNDGTLKLWRVDSPGLLNTLSGHAGWVHAAVVLAGDRFVLSGSKDGFVKAWRVDKGTQVAEHWAGASVLSLAVHRRGPYVAAGDSNGQVHLLALVNAPDVEPVVSKNSGDTFA